MQGDDPPFLPVGTDVSAKYKGAFCEAKVKKVVRNIKCKVTLKAGGGTTTVNDDVIKGTLRVGSTVEVKQDPKKEAMEAIITKIQDCSQYTVVFDDGDITTLRRSALCLKSGRHFNESETLDQLPLTHPEHFSTPVIAGRRGRRGRAQSEESEESGSGRRQKAESVEREREPHVGRVVLVEAAGGAERRRPHQPAFPALVVAPTAQIKVKEDYLVRSFKDGRYYTVPKKEAREFRKGSAPLEWSGVEAALQYLNNGVLPPHWDRDALFNEPRNTSDDSSDDEPREEKDHFVAQLYKFMDDRGTPLNRNPTIANRDIDLYRLFRVVQKLGGYNRVTNQNQWKTIAGKMGFHPVTASITNLCKQAYKKFLHSFEDFYRKLGVTLVAHPRGARTPPAGRSLIRDRDKQLPTSSSASSTPTGTPVQMQRVKGDKDSDKSETDKSEKSERDEKEKDKRGSDGEDSADNQPLANTTPKVEKEKEKEKVKEEEKSVEKIVIPRSQRSQSKTRSTSSRSTPSRSIPSQSTPSRSIPSRATPSRSMPSSSTSSTKIDEKRLPKRKPLSSKPGRRPLLNIGLPHRFLRRPIVRLHPSAPRESDQGARPPSRRSSSTPSAGESPTTSTSRASRRPLVSTDSDSSGRASRCGLKKMPTRRSQSANSASSGNTIASNSSKRPRKRKNTEPSTSEPIRATSNVKAEVGDKLKVYYGPTQSESKVTYEAKVIEISAQGMLRVHYTGWNTRYDEWIKPQRIALNVTQHEQRNKKGTGMSRRIRAKRTEESSARSDSDSDSDSGRDQVKRPPKKSEDKSSSKPPSRTNDAAKSSDSSSSSKPRKRPMRSGSTPLNTSPAKKLRPNAQSHAGRDYDLNEIRSELKGLHTVKQEPEETSKKEIKQEKETSPAPESAPQLDPPKLEKKEEDVYEFKEPEPFELELHDEKKKRTHRIFDDISPSKYTSTLSKSLSEEISEDPLRPGASLRSPSLSPFREFGTVREAADRQSTEDDTKDDMFSMDDDSFQDGSSGPIFEGFTPAKNQETYSKKSKVSKLRELIDDSPDSPADDEQSSEDEPEDVLMKEDDRESTPSETSQEDTPKSPEPTLKGDDSNSKDPEPESEEADSETVSKDVPEIDLSQIPEPPEPPPENLDLMDIELPITTIDIASIPMPDSTPLDLEDVTEIITEEEIKLESIPLPSSEPKEPNLKLQIEKLNPEPVLSTPSILEPPSSPLVDTEEDKSEPDSPARLDVIPDPPPGFLLQSEGPKIAEKLLKAINSAKRLSMSPPPVENRPITPKKDVLKVTKLEENTSPVSTERRSITPTNKTEPLKPLAKTEAKKASPEVVQGAKDSIFGEPSIMTDVKRDVAEVNKVKPKDPTPPRLQSPLSILERRKSVADLPLSAPGKNNKVLSDTIQKLSSQINQSAASIALPFPAEERSESSDSDDSDRRLIIDKLTSDDWSGAEPVRPAAPPAAAPAPANPKPTARDLHAGKSPGEWSAGETLLMLEDACKNERKHSASVVVAGTGSRPAASAGEEDALSMMLLCSETIPGSPAPDAEPAPPRQRLHMPFACAPPHHHHKEERRSEDPTREAPAAADGGPRVAGVAGGGEGAVWPRRATLLDNTPPTTPDSSDDLSPQPNRNRRMSERDSPTDRKEDEDEPRGNDASMDIDKPHRPRSRKASECSGFGSGAGRGRRRARRDTDDANDALRLPLKYNFYVELDPLWDGQTRINVLMSRLSDLRKTYHSVKAELAAIDRRRKKLRRKEREAVKAAKAACS